MKGGMRKDRQDREVVRKVCVCDISLCNRAANLRRRKKQRQRDMCVREGAKKERQNFDLSRNIDTVGWWWMGKGEGYEMGLQKHLYKYMWYR